METQAIPLPVETLTASQPADAARWKALISQSAAPDVYYLPEYALAGAEIEHTIPVAVLSGRFLAPMLLRSVSVSANASSVEWMDAASPYGYGGLLELSPDRPVTINDLQSFFEELQAWCRLRKIVCCVLRLHPLIDQRSWFESVEIPNLKMHLRGQTAAILLADWDDEHDRPQGMRKGRRSDLTLARRSLHVTWVTGNDPDVKASLDQFAALYEESMERHDADSFHRFSRRFFESLAGLGDHLHIACAWHNGELAGASIFLTGRDYAHYYLAAVNTLGREHCASTLLIVEGAGRARNLGCRQLHLGGGMSPGDSLESFKFGFGNMRHQYAYLTYVADPEHFERIARLPAAPWPYRIAL